MRTPSRSQRRRDERGEHFDRRLVTAVTVVAAALLALAVYALDPSKAMGWSWQVLMLCVLASAVAGRALLRLHLAPRAQGAFGVRGPADLGENAQSWLFPRSAMLLWTLLIGAAVLPNLYSLGVGFLADDYALLRTARLARGALDAIRAVPLQSFHRPVSQLVWWLGLRAWGGAPVGYHALSVLLHAANVALLHLVARRYTGSVYGGAMAALLFAVHPYHVETTTWIAAQPDLLCLFFSLISMWCLEEYLCGGRRRGLALAGSLSAFALALLSKEAAMALPGLGLVHVALFPGRGLRRATGVTAPFAFVLVGYLGLRWMVLGKHWLGGYQPDLLFWNTVFPSMPLRIMAGFFFPVHQGLLASMPGPYLGMLLISLMGLGLLWWMRGIEFIPGHRAALCLGYLFLLSVPVWTLSYSVFPNMLNSRYAYLPSVGLALLFGQIQTWRHERGARGELAGTAILVGALLLSMWYTMPWRHAARLRDDVLAAGVQLVSGLPQSPPPTALLVKGVPAFRQGAPVFVSSYSIALAELLSRPLAIEEVSSRSGELEIVSLSDLRRGEYLVSWDGQTRSMVVERSGSRAAATGPQGGRP